MIGIWKSYLHIYLYVVAVATLVGYGIPLLVAPVRWAQVFRWDIPQPDHLIVALGRSLGAFTCILAAFAFKAANTPAVQPFFFDLLLWAFVGQTLTHIYGAIRKIQPITETVEILLWVLLFLVTLAFYPS